jgi:tetratricopeptide (TPR) repeat protein
MTFLQATIACDQVKYDKAVNLFKGIRRDGPRIFGNTTQAEFSTLVGLGLQVQAIEWTDSTRKQALVGQFDAIIALAALQAKRYSEAIAYLSHRNDLGRPGKEILAEAYFGLGEYRKAEDAYRRVMADAPLDGRIHSNLGVVYACQGKYPDAREEFGVAWRINKDDAVAFVAAVVFHLEGFYEPALRLFVDFKPKEYGALRLLGVGSSQAMLGMKTEALNTYAVLKKESIHYGEMVFKLVYD